MCLGIPGKVVEVFREHDLLMGKVDFGGVLKRVCLEYIPEVAVGEYALVHVGFALTRLDETEAQRTLALLKEAGELDHSEPDGGREVP
jgi:hydrogenase expression/formation protein HypC